MSESTREYITESGRLIRHHPDGSKTYKCLTDECIRQHVEGESKQKCDCEECASERLAKSSGDRYTVGELREALPEEIFEEVMNQLDLDDSPPESMDEVGKALSEDLYDAGTVEKSGVAPSHHLIGPDPFEEPEVDISKSPAELDRFYEAQGENR